MGNHDIRRRAVLGLIAAPRAAYHIRRGGRSAGRSVGTARITRHPSDQGARTATTMGPVARGRLGRVLCECCEVRFTGKRSSLARGTMAWSNCRLGIITAGPDQFVGGREARHLRQGSQQRALAQMVRWWLERLGIPGRHHRRLSSRGIVVVGPHRCIRARYGQCAVAQVVRRYLA
jgi:hypothetical protein